MIIINRNKILKRLNNIPDILKDAIYSDELNNKLIEIFNQFNLSEDKQQKIFYLCLLIFTGFLYRKDLYKEMQNVLSFDKNLAIELYNELNKKVFFIYKKYLDPLYSTYFINKNENILESKINNKNEQVVLKLNNKINKDTTINLKSNNIAFTNNNSNANKIKNNAVSIKLNKKPEDLKKGDINIKEDKYNKDKAINKDVKNAVKYNDTSSDENKNENKSNEIEVNVNNSGPVILHKKEDLKTIENSVNHKFYKTAAFGGFGGSFNSPFEKVNNKEEKAKIEMPFNSKNENDSVNIPITNKYKKEKIKKINYSSFKSDLNNNNNINEEKNDEGFIDLSSMTIKK